MSSLRPAKIVATLYQLIEAALSSPVEPDGPGCSCKKCDEAWSRNQTLNRITPRAHAGQGLRRVNPG